MAVSCNASGAVAVECYVDMAVVLVNCGQMCSCVLQCWEGGWLNVMVEVMCGR